MGSSTLNSLLKDYEQKKYTAELNFEKNKSLFYSSHPELADIKEKLGKLALDISKAVLNSDLELEKKLKVQFESLKLEKENLLKNTEIPKRCFRAFL